MGLGLHKKSIRHGEQSPFRAAGDSVQTEYRVVKASNFIGFSGFYAHTQCHSQLNVCARAAEMTKLTIHHPSAPCQLNQHKAAKITVHCPLSESACAALRRRSGDAQALKTYSGCGCLSSVSPWPELGLLHLCKNKR